MNGAMVAKYNFSKVIYASNINQKAYYIYHINGGYMYNIKIIYMYISQRIGRYGE